MTLDLVLMLAANAAVPKGYTAPAEAARAPAAAASAPPPPPEHGVPDIVIDKRTDSNGGVVVKTYQRGRLLGKVCGPLSLLRCLRPARNCLEGPNGPAVGEGGGGRVALPHAPLPPPALSFMRATYPTVYSRTYFYVLRLSFPPP